MRLIRLATRADAPAVTEVYKPSVVGSARSFEYELPSSETMADRIEETLSYLPWLVCTDGDTVLGYAYAARHRERAAYQWSLDVSVYVHPAVQGRGVGAALYTSLFALLRAQGFHALHAGITLPNPASVRLHESLGFRPVGVYPAVGWKLDAWHDVGWWQLELHARVGQPAAPQTIGSLRDTPTFHAALAAGVARLGSGR